MEIMNIDIVIKAIIALLIKSISIPSISNSPITLNGIPYFMRSIDILSDVLGSFLPMKNPKNKKGIIIRSL